MEIDIIQMLLSPKGGLMAVGIGIGASGGWAFCQRTIVALHVKRLEEMRNDFLDRDEECKKRCDYLEQRVMQLEQEKFDMAINKI